MRGSVATTSLGSYYELLTAVVNSEGITADLYVTARTNQCEAVYTATADAEQSRKPFTSMNTAPQATI
jgi:hypothetical protein